MTRQKKSGRSGDTKRARRDTLEGPDSLAVLVRAIDAAREWDALVERLAFRRRSRRRR